MLRWRRAGAAVGALRGVSRERGLPFGQTPPHIPVPEAEECDFLACTLGEPSNDASFAPQCAPA